MANWGGFGSGFAGGVTAGSTAMSRAIAAEIEQENQKYLNEKRAEEKAFQSAIKTGSAEAALTDDTGYRITDAQGNTQFVSAKHGDFGRQTYADLVDAQGKPLYTVSDTPEKYQQAETKAGIMLGQREYTPEQQEMGRGPMAGLQEQYNADKFKRLEQIAIQHDRPERAAAYGNIQMNALQREKISEELKDLPQIREHRGLQIESARETVAGQRHTNEVNRRAAEWMAASETQATAIEHYNNKFKDGSTAEPIVDPKTGMTQLWKVDSNGNKTMPLGDPYKSWNEGGKQQIQANIPELAKESYKLDIQHKHKLAEIKAQGDEHVRYARALKEDKRVNMNEEQKKRFAEIEAEIYAAGDDEQKLRIANQKMAVFSNQIAMAHGIMPKPYVFQKSGRDFTADDLQKFGKAQAEFLEIAPKIYPGWEKMSPAAQEKILKERNLWALPGKPQTAPNAGGGGNTGRPATSGGNAVQAPSGLPFTPGAASIVNQGGGQQQQQQQPPPGGLQVRENVVAASPFDQYISSAGSGQFSIKVPSDAPPAYKELDRRSFPSKDAARAALQELQQRTGARVPRHPGM